MEVDEKETPVEEKVEEKPKVVEPEPNSQNLTNFARVLPRQWKHISFTANNRYSPVVKVNRDHIY
jgi:hypothetical protein